MTIRLLVLGGTGFVGPAIIEDARSRGWHVTVFNRGTRRPDPDVTVLQGDRVAPGGLTALTDGTWDIAVDTWSGAPTAVRDAGALLADRVGRFVYVSSRSVYTFPPPAGADEHAPVVEASPDDGDLDFPEGYARAKAGAELAATAAFGDRVLLARAGLILGPHEDVGRLPWWLARITRGGPLLAPGPADAAVQYIDVRDLATFVLDAADRGLAGPYDLVCPVGHTTMGDVLEACVSVTGSDAELRWTPADRILAAGIEPWTDLPIWLPPGELHDAMHGSDVSKAVAAGLRCRPITDTVADTWRWLRDLGGSPPQRADRPPVGMDPDVEAALLEQPAR
ncbi:SDR family oxidoreductase [soil metagenome]